MDIKRAEKLLLHLFYCSSTTILVSASLSTRTLSLSFTMHLTCSSVTARICCCSGSRQSSSIWTARTPYQHSPPCLRCLKRAGSSIHPWLSRESLGGACLSIFDIDFDTATLFAIFPCVPASVFPLFLFPISEPQSLLNCMKHSKCFFGHYTSHWEV